MPSLESRIPPFAVLAIVAGLMYLGALVMLIAWALWLANAVAFLVVPTFVLYLNRFQIIPAEKALTTRFGPEFAAYCANVRRWI